MRPLLTCFRYGLVLVAAGLALAGLAYGQARVAAAKVDKSDAVRIRRLVGAGARILVDSPKYQVTSVPGGVKPFQKWGRITVTYDTTADWMDELSFQFFVMAKKTEGGKSSFSLYSATVRYMDIRKGAGHESDVFLRPTALERYGEVVASAVEISSGGKLLVEETHTEGIKLPDRWWRQPAVVESKDVVVRDGYLLDRAHSPFALVNIDDQEAIRQ